MTILKIFRNNPKYFLIIFKLFLEIILSNFPKIIFEIFWYFSRKLYEICFENFLKNFEKIHFWILTPNHFKLKLKNLWVTVPHKRNRSNTENIESRPVMSLLQLYPLSWVHTMCGSYSWCVMCHDSRIVCMKKCV